MVTGGDGVTAPTYAEWSALMDQRRAELEAQPHFVYTVWMDRTPAYVGCTTNVKRRIREHSSNGRLWAKTGRVEVFEFATRSEARDAERVRISKLRPAGNLQHNPAHIDLLDVMYYGEYPDALINKLADDRHRVGEERQRQWHEARGFEYIPWPQPWPRRSA